jgi:5-methyltetrahydrofolate--homocysteine methyltransferase
MRIIGEKLNGTLKKTGAAIQARDVKFIQELAQAQVQAGAYWLDVNAGTHPDREKEDFCWLIKTVQEVVDTPLCLDSASPEVLAAGLEIVKGQVLLNSTTAETEKAKAVIPLAAKYNCQLIGLTLVDTGMPATADERFEIAKQIVDQAKAAGIPAENIYIDPLVRAISAEPEQGRELLNATWLISHKLAPVNVVYGLSNISFGLPGRPLLNRTLLAMAMASGLGAAIMDPTDKHIMAVLRASEALLGQDEFCMNYMTAFRDGSLG